MIDISSLAKYAELKRQISSLEAQAKELQPAVLSALSATGAIAAEGYQLKLKTRKSWKYPQSVQEAADKLKLEKLKAEADGTAAFTESTYIECKLSDG